MHRQTEHQNRILGNLDRYMSERRFKTGHITKSITIRKALEIIDGKGNFVINPQFTDVRDFSNDKAAARLGKDWGYVNGKGEWIVNPQFEKARDFGKTRAMVMKNGEWGWIDNNGKYVINPQFPNAYNFVKIAW